MYSLMLDSGDIINPFIDVELTIRDGVVYTKNLVITDITKEIVDGKDSYFSIKFFRWRRFIMANFLQSEVRLIPHY